MMQTSDRILAAMVTGAAGAGVVGYFAGQPGVFVGAIGVAAATGALAVASRLRDNLDANRDAVGVVEGEFTETTHSKDLALPQVRGGA